METFDNSCWTSESFVFWIVLTTRLMPKYEITSAFFPKKPACPRVFFFSRKPINYWWFSKENINAAASFLASLYFTVPQSRQDVKGSVWKYKARPQKSSSYRSVRITSCVYYRAMLSKDEVSKTRKKRWKMRFCQSKNNISVSVKLLNISDFLRIKNKPYLSYFKDSCSPPEP